MMQFAMAAGAGIGGIFVEKVSLASITWFGALGVMIAIVVVLTTFSSRKAKTCKRNQFIIALIGVEDSRVSFVISYLLF